MKARYTRIYKQKTEKLHYRETAMMKKKKKKNGILLYHRGIAMMFEKKTIL